MKKNICISFSIFLGITGYCQLSPNMENSAPLSPTTEAASKLSSIPVNFFTGVPNISVPIYSYSSSTNGLSLGISIDYFSGGTQVAESPTTVGLNWFLSAGGEIARTVRGMPDDYPTYGYMYASSIPTDYRSNGDKYYYDSLDAEQDIFQFNFNGRGGQFYIGKNGQILSVPSSKLKITYTTSSSSLVAFRIITEDGVKYDFNDVESTTVTVNSPSSTFYNTGFSGSYNSAWYLSRIISPFSTDTIKFTYSSTSVNYQFGFPQVTFVRTSDGVRTTTYTPTGSNSSTITKISSIAFPDKTTVSFIYGCPYVYANNDLALSKIKIGDTTFRYGYNLNYTTTISGNSTRLLLSGVTPYTPKEYKDGYSFFYNTPFFAPLGSGGDTIQNKRDYWGYYNGANNGTNLIPQVNGYSWGANRNPNFSYATANSLHYFYLPGGGYIIYDYELNDHLPYTKDVHQITKNPTTTTQDSVTLNQVFNTKHQLVFALDTSVSRSGSAPISGTGNYILNLKSSDGSVTYLSDTLSLYDLFYLGMKTWTFNIANGNYRLDASPPASTTITGSFPINISWENRILDTTHTATTAGGLRVKKVTRKNAYDDPSISFQYLKYIRTDGKSSGFFGDIPKYDYLYGETVNNGGTTKTNYDLVSSEPVSNMNYAQGSPVGYSRVEVVEGDSSHNIGKTVYEFTDLTAINTNIFTPTFPYAPNNMRDWGLGLPKKISVYDSAGNLIKKTVTTYGYDSLLYNNTNFKSLKLGHTYTVYNGDPSNPSTPKVRTYIGQEYYASGGRIYPTSVADTLFQSNGTTNTSSKSFVYDTNYNVIKVITSYDRTRGLSLENRIYYPYNYIIGGAIGKLRDSSIIAVPVASESWITGDSNPRILSGTITAFKQLTQGYIKPDTLFILQSNKPIGQSTIGNFDSSKLNRNYTYFKAQTSFPAYDSKANPLQVSNLISGQNSSVIMDYNQNYAVAKISNAANSDVAYTSFEADGSGNWTIASATRDTAAITGKQGYNLSNGNITKSSLNTSLTYILTLWAKTTTSITVNGSSVTSYISQVNNWNLYSLTLSGISSITISGSGVIDELRLHPKDANMVSNTYTPLIGTTATTGANNTIVYNEYDNLNRIKLIRDRNKNILKRYDYSDSAMSITVNPIFADSLKVCSGGSGHYYWFYEDVNPFSDTYGCGFTGGSGTDCVTCPFTCTGEGYKLINCVCELGQRCNTSTTYMKIWDNGCSCWVWKWRCIYHYIWSDGSTSSDYTEYNNSACYIGACGGS